MAEMLVVVSYFGAMTVAVWLIGVVTGGEDEAPSQQERVVVKARSDGAHRSTGRQGNSPTTTKTSWN